MKSQASPPAGADRRWHGRNPDAGVRLGRVILRGREVGRRVTGVAPCGANP